MSRIDDNDAQKRAQEAQLRQRLDNEKHLNKKRTEKAFREVMVQSGQLKQAHETSRQSQTQDQRALAKQVLEKVRKDMPKTPAELARRAALSRAMHGRMTKIQGQEVDQARLSEQMHVEGHVEKSDTELERVSRTTRDEDDREVTRAEERQAEIEQERAQGSLQAVGEEPRRRQNRGGGGGSQRRDQNRSDGVGATDGPRAAHRVQIPPEALKQLVGAIYKASQDGRTHLQVTLKGDMFDGVQLTVRSQGGKVSCEFGNCDPNLSRLLKSSQGALARGLSQRGLALQSLSVR